MNLNFHLVDIKVDFPEPTADELVHPQSRKARRASRAKPQMSAVRRGGAGAAAVSPCESTRCWIVRSRRVAARRIRFEPPLPAPAFVARTGGIVVAAA